MLPFHLLISVSTNTYKATLPILNGVCFVLPSSAQLLFRNHILHLMPCISDPSTAVFVSDGATDKAELVFCFSNLHFSHQNIYLGLLEGVRIMNYDFIVSKSNSEAK